MTQKMRWTYWTDTENLARFSYAIYPAIQTINVSEFNLQKSATFVSLNEIRLTFNYQDLLGISKAIRNENPDQTYLIHELMTLLITDLMTMMNRDWPDLFGFWQTLYSEYFIRFDMHMGE